MPATLAMIRRGDLALKNQEEIGLFSDPDTLPAGIRRTMRRQREVQEQRAALEEARAALPSVIDEQHLTAEVARLQREREVKTAARARAEGQQEISRASYARERESLLSRATALAKREVVISVPDLPPT